MQQTSSTTPGGDAQPTIVEEKIVNKETGESTLRKYLKGRFLGKVSFFPILSVLIGRLRLSF